RISIVMTGSTARRRAAADRRFVALGSAFVELAGVSSMMGTSAVETGVDAVAEDPVITRLAVEVRMYAATQAVASVVGTRVAVIRARRSLWCAADVMHLVALGSAFHAASARVTGVNRTRATAAGVAAVAKNPIVTCGAVRKG